MTFHMRVLTVLIDAHDEYPIG